MYPGCLLEIGYAGFVDTLLVLNAGNRRRLLRQNVYLIFFTETERECTTEQSVHDDSQTKPLRSNGQRNVNISVTIQRQKTYIHRVE